MPTHKMSGERGSQRETPTTKKNNAFFDAYMSDLRKDGTVKDVHVARVIRNVGNGRVDVFYIGDQMARVEKAYIRGLFRGKGKHSVNIDVNSIVLVADSGISGAAQYEIMAMLSPVQIRELRKVAEPDPRVLNFEATDGNELVKNDGVEAGGYDFHLEVEPKADDEEVDIDHI